MVEKGEDDKTLPVSVNVRLSPEVDRMVVDLIRSGKHTTKSDVLKTALMEYLNRQLVMERFHENILKEMNDPEFRERMKEIFREFLSGMVSDK